MSETASKRGAVAIGIAMWMVVAAGWTPVASAPTQSGLSGPAEAESIAQWTQRWLDGPVKLIATAQERQIYAGLSTTQERLQFIRLFWERRDPHVRGPRNEYLDEFAARLSYAEEHYGNGREPSWETAFGRVVMIFGPPDRTRRELSGFPPGFSDRPPILWSYDSRLPGLEPNEDLLFVFRAGRWKLMPPYSDSSVPEVMKQAERVSNVGVTIPSDYQQSMELKVQESLAQPVDYETAIDTVRTAVQLPDAQIPFGYTVEQQPAGDGKVQLQIELTWRMDSLVFLLVDGEFRTDMVIDVQLQRGGDAAAATSENITVSVPEADMQSRRDEVVRRSVTLTADPGEQELVMVLMDQLLGYRTVYREPIEVR